MDLLSNAFRQRLIQSILTDSTLLRDARRFVDPEDFPEGTERTLVSFALFYYDEFGLAPDEFVIEERSHDLGFDEDEIPEIMAQYGKPNDSPAFVKRRLIDFARNRRLLRSMEKASGMLGTEDWESIIDTLREAEVYGDLNPPTSLSLPFDADKITSHEALDLPCTPTGIEVIDDDIGGGLPIGHIGCIVAPPNHGKSTFLIAFGAKAVRCGKNVVHFTLEMSKEQTAIRYNQATYGVAFRKGPRRKSSNGRLHIIEAMGKKKISDLSGQIKTLPFTPDMVIVDYAALARPNREFKEYRHMLAEIFRDLRSLAQELKASLWTAHQATRSAMSDGNNRESTITMAHLSESFEIAAIVDVMLTLNATETERHQDVCRVYMAKNRIGPANATATVFCDYSKCRVTDQAVED